MIREIKIKVHNVQALKDFEADLSGNIIVITGGNDKGKTTLRNVIAKSLGANINLDVTKGKTDGFIETSIVTKSNDVYIFKCEVTEEGETVYLIDKDGKRFKDSRARTELKDLFGLNNLTLEEILSLIKTPEGKRKLFKEMLKALPEEKIQIYLDNEMIYDKSKGIAFRKRTEVNSTLKTYQEISTSVSFSDEDIYNIKHEEDIKQAYKQLENDIKIHEDNIYKQDNIQFKIESAERDIESLTAQIKVLEERKKSYITSLADLVKEKETIKIDTVKYEKDKERFEKAKTVMTNLSVLIEKFKAKEGMAQKIIDTQKQADDLTKTIDNARQENQKLIQEADFGIKNLEISEEGIFVNGIELDPTKMSNSEMLITCAKIFRAINKKTDVVLVGNAEGIGMEKLKQLVNDAFKNDYMLIFEMFNDNDELNIKENWTFKS